MLLNIPDSLFLNIVLPALGILLAFELFSRVKNQSLKKLATILISAGLIIWLDPRSFFVLLGLSSFIFFLIKSKLSINRWILPISISLMLVLIFIKDYGYFFQIDNPYIPLGVSYYFFRLISLLIEYSKKPSSFENLEASEYFLWIFFFPIFLAGPILRFSEFYTLSPKEHDAKKFAFYKMLFVGFILKISLVDMLLFPVVYEVFYSQVTNPKFEISFLVGFSFSFLAFLHAYLDLMLYTEMSKGIAGILGYSNAENFNRPLLATNISQFWQRWHMSLSNWTRDYVFFPLLVKSRKTWLAAYGSMLTIGIWHAATANWVFWALMHGTALNLYGEIRVSKLYLRIKKNWFGVIALSLLGNLFTIFFVSIVFIFVAINDFETAWSVFVRTFNPEN